MEAARLANRQSIRRKGWDYAAAGCYFVTINTHRGRALFGAIVNGRVVLSEAGRVAEEEWRKSAVIRKGIELDEYVIMPNHVHGIVRIEGRTQGLGAPSPYGGEFGKPVAGALGTLVGAYKAAVSREMRRLGLIDPARPIWHRNYWDVIVRDGQALAGIRKYIRENPQNYETVLNVGEPRWAGNRKLLELPKMGFAASRGAGGLPAGLTVKPGEAILSSFLSPMERKVFTAGLERRWPLIWVKPWGLEENAGPPPVRRAIEDGRLLIVSPFADSLDAPNVRRAVWCNQYVLMHCDRMVVGYLNPGGMLACVLSESDPELEIHYL